MTPSSDKDAAAKKAEEEAAKRRSARRREFSKRVIAALIVMWFIGAVFGAAIVTMQTVAGSYFGDLSALLTYIGAPMTGGVVTYLLKSAFENKEKIRQSFMPEYMPGERDEP